VTKRILVVDDEEMILDLCSHILKNEGYDVSCASSGEEAVTRDLRNQLHMVVTDMLMPGKDGLETFLALRDKYHDLIGILITGHGTMDMAIQAIKQGFSAFIRKPFTPKELVQVVKDSFHKAALIEENTRLKTLMPLYRLGEKFMTSMTRKEVLDELIKTVSQQTTAQRVSVMFYDEREACLRIVAAKGIKDEIIRNVRIKPGEKIAGRVFQRGKPLILNGGPEGNPKFAPFLQSKDIIAAISFPLKSRERTLGVLNISKTGQQGSPFTHADIEMLSVICGQAVMALENIRVMDERAEKVRMRTIFEQYVSPEVAGMVLSQKQNPIDIGEITYITVLFADIRNFTPLVQHLPLETLRSFLNDFFGLLSEVIFKFRGTIDKFMGDALLAFFGAPIPLKNPENIAVKSAIAMLKAFDELKQTWIRKKKPLDDIGLGIGISSGEMFLGNLGSRKRFNYTVIGSDVNLAQRLSSEAASGEILISNSVKAKVGLQFRVAHESFRLLKGLERPMPVYSIAIE